MISMGCDQKWAKFGLGGRLRSSEGEFLKVGRQGDPNRLKELTSAAGGRGAQQAALAILLKLDFLQPVETAPDVVPFGCDVVPVEAILEFLDEQQGNEGAEHVAANGHVAAVVDWASGKHGLGLDCGRDTHYWPSPAVG